MEKRELTWSEKRYNWQQLIMRALFVLAGAALLSSGLTLSRCLFVTCSGLEITGNVLGFLAGLIALVTALTFRRLNQSGIGRRIEILQWYGKKVEEKRKERPKP